jgi:hypothetical protein
MNVKGRVDLQWMMMIQDERCRVVVVVVVCAQQSGCFPFVSQK